MGAEVGGITAFGVSKAFLTKGGCSETLFSVLNRAFGHVLEMEERAAAPFYGGILQHGYQCGQVWGAALAAGAEAHHRLGPGGRAQAGAIRAATRVTEVFFARNRTLDCFDLTHLNEKASTLQLLTTFLFKGQTVTCMRIASRFAPEAYRAIGEALSGANAEAHAVPVGCAALLAQRLGASELHSTMAAGMAGGIGLSGGGCGALGAAIWLMGLRHLQAGGGEIPFKALWIQDLINRFLKSSDYEFECARIVGRSFRNVEDHACHVCQGGCAGILDALAAAPEPF